MAPTVFPLSGQHVLVVEDNFLLAEDLAIGLEEAGAVIVGQAGNVHEALDLIWTAEKLDTAVLNVHLGDELSFPIADVLASLEVPFIFLTGSMMADVPLAHATVMRVFKPVEPAAVARLLHEAHRAQRLAGRTTPPWMQ